MNRAFYSDTIGDGHKLLSGATVEVREVGTETPIAETLYAADGPDVTELANPFTISEGRIEFYLTNEKQVDLYITKQGYQPRTITVLVENVGIVGVTDHGGLSGLSDDDHPQYSPTTHDHAGVFDPAGTATSEVGTHASDAAAHHAAFVKADADALYALLLHRHTTFEALYIEPPQTIDDYLPDPNTGDYALDLGASELWYFGGLTWSNLGTVADPNGTAAAAVSAHAGNAAAHHASFVQADADALYDALGAASGAVADHEDGGVGWDHTTFALKTDAQIAGDTADAALRVTPALTKMGIQVLPGKMYTGSVLDLGELSVDESGNIVSGGGLQALGAITTWENAAYRTVATQYWVGNNYAALGHDHDADYSALGHGHAEADITFATNDGTRHDHVEADVTDLGSYITDMVNDTTPQLGGDLDLNEKYVQIKEAPSSDHTGSGMMVSMTAGESLVPGDVVYFKSDGKVWKADCNGTSTYPAMGIALETKSADTACKVLLHGIFRDDTYTWTVGGIVYLSATAGAMTQTAPSTSGDRVQVLGVATHADRVYFNPAFNLLVVA